jgi:hypothetical protein
MTVVKKVAKNATIARGMILDREASLRRDLEGLGRVIFHDKKEEDCSDAGS